MKSQIIIITDNNRISRFLNLLNIPFTSIIKLLFINYQVYSYNFVRSYIELREYKIQELLVD